MQILKSILGTLLALTMLSAGAAPATEDYSGSPGGAVTVVLSETTANIPFGMVVLFTYDDAVLKLKDVRAGSLWGNNVIFTQFPDPQGGTVLLSDGPVSGTGSLLELDFTIKAPPANQVFPYFTNVTFNGDFACVPTDPQTKCDDIPFDQVTSTITIDRGTQIPLPGTLPLIALGIASLVWTRRRRH